MKGTNNVKRLLAAAGALIMGMALVTGFAGCKTDDDEKDALDGTTWVGSTTISEYEVTATLTCNSPNWLLTGVVTGTTSAFNINKGTYSVSGDTVSITPTHSWDKDAEEWKAVTSGGTMTGTLSGNTLTIPQSKGENLVFTKQ